MIAPPDRGAPLVRREFRLAPEFHALGFRIGAASRRALLDASAFELRGDAKHGENQFRKIGRGIDDRLGQRTQAGPGLLKVAAIISKSVVSRDRRSTAATITTSP